MSSSSGHHAEEQATVSWSTEVREAFEKNDYLSFRDALNRGSPPGLMFPMKGKGGKGGRKGGKGGPTAMPTRPVPATPPKSPPSPGIEVSVVVEEIPSDTEESEEVSIPAPKT